MTTPAIVTLSHTGSSNSDGAESAQFYWDEAPEQQPALYDLPAKIHASLARNHIAADRRGTIRITDWLRKWVASESNDEGEGRWWCKVTTKADHR